MMRAQLGEFIVHTLYLCTNSVSAKTPAYSKTDQRQPNPVHTGISSSREEVTCAFYSHVGIIRGAINGDAKHILFEHCSHLPLLLPGQPLLLILSERKRRRWSRGQCLKRRDPSLARQEDKDVHILKALHAVDRCTPCSREIILLGGMAIQEE